MTRFLAAKLIFREERSEKLSSVFVAFNLFLVELIKSLNPPVADPMAVKATPKIQAKIAIDKNFFFEFILAMTCSFLCEKLS